VPGIANTTDRACSTPQDVTATRIPILESAIPQSMSGINLPCLWSTMASTRRLPTTAARLVRPHSFQSYCPVRTSVSTERRSITSTGSCLRADEGSDNITHCVCLRRTQCALISHSGQQVRIATMEVKQLVRSATISCRHSHLSS